MEFATKRIKKMDDEMLLAVWDSLKGGVPNERGPYDCETMEDWMELIYCEKCNRRL